MSPEDTPFPPTVRLKSSGSAFPPLSLVVSLMIVSFGAKSSFVIVHVTSVSPSDKVTTSPSRSPPEQSQIVGAYPPNDDSDSVYDVFE